MTNKESQSVEYKQTWRDDCLKAISAFANSVGGTLFIGLDDQGKPSGLKNVKRLLEDIPNTIRNKRYKQNNGNPGFDEFGGKRNFKDGWYW